VPERASFPNRTVWTILGCLTGLIGSSALVLSGVGSPKRGRQ
jgi:uncharacterized protein involved in exopolysaccharide biosynthesis